MNSSFPNQDQAYRDAMGQLLVLYTQVDQLIMEICAERIASAPDLATRLGLAKQVGDESRHVQIQNDWMRKFGTDTAPVISEAQQEIIRAHFRSLSWTEFLADMYLCVEALGSEAVENIVPLADPGTRQSLHVPLEDELDHIAFGISCLRKALSELEPEQREQFLAKIPGRIDELTQRFHGLGMDVEAMFSAVGADYRDLCNSVLKRRNEVIGLAAA